MAQSPAGFSPHTCVHHIIFSSTFILAQRINFIDFFSGANRPLDISDLFCDNTEF
jgi:hypothetical protein